MVTATSAAVAVAMMVASSSSSTSILVPYTTTTAFTFSPMDNIVARKRSTTTTLLSRPHHHRHHQTSFLSMTSSSSQWEQQTKRRSIKLPLLDLSSTSTSEYSNKIVTPLPSAHLPPELRTINLYGMELDRPVHKMLIQNAIDRGGNVKGELGVESERVYGHIVWKPTNGEDGSSLVGSVGCTAEVLISAPSTTDDKGGEGTKKGDDDDEDGGGPITVLVRGGYRFIVREVTQTFPFPVGVVDELLDDDIEEPSTPVTKSTNDDEEEDDDYDTYTNLTPAQLIQKTLQSTNDLLQQQLTETTSTKQQLTPLEQSILESKGVPITSAITEQNQVEEMIAVLHIFQSTLIDIALSSNIQQYYVVAMMAAELSNVDNDIRTKILLMKNGLERLRLLLKIVDDKVKMGKARKMATQITDEADEDMKDLKVGTPELPPWSKSITRGTRIEYYWSEEDGWCAGEVIESPMKIVDELVVTVRFDDGETHRLPFRPEEKARWRPSA